MKKSNLVITVVALVGLLAVDANGAAVTKKNGTTLEVESNTSWSLSTSKTVLKSPDGANAANVLNTLSVALETTSGTGKDKDIKVDYTLDNLEICHLATT